ncbi:pre-rRNA 2'-O-ribose RNA methyltransferase FTSJ3 [Condylostylus longicornis]|uniref:pre-rRNA 2'-O-ribose RNA methyltransferase FTSJ3 n=1 Tax=Condylostylus longicornis TaxID=2530218 RepID=UPI00244DAD6B|nr:pre-rRNA 2'-O-ribose RNA methyltransferase FTSJ3 [Condylostylus longicornis]
MGKKTKVGKTRKDKFYKLAKETGFRSRAAFKLIQLNRKFGFLQQSQVCIDLCAAPGGWMQVAKQNMPVSSIVVGVDLYPIKPITGCISLVEDITTDKCKTSLSKELKTWKADVILHDGAPNVGKNWLYDAYQQICLTLQALKLSTNFLRSNGWFVTKVFRSKDYNALLWVLKQLFKKVHATKPSASRKESAEIFVVCQGYLAPTKIDPKLLDPKYVFEELDLDNKKPSLLHPENVKRIKAEGYTEKEVSLRNEMSVIDFMENENPLLALQGAGSILINHEGVKNHPKTTLEILECCKDIKVLGRKDIKGLLLWHKHVRADLFKQEEKKVEEVDNTTPIKEFTVEELEEIEMEELEKQIAELTEEERKEAKRKKKKMLKERAKLNEKMNLKMVIKGDEGPRDEGDDGVFVLKDITNEEELNALQDIAPDFVVEDEMLAGGFIPKYKKYQKEESHLDDDGNVNSKNATDDENESISSEESNYDETGLGLSEDEDENKKLRINKTKKKKKELNPLIKSCDYRDKDTRRQHRVQLWYEKDNLNVAESEDEEHDLNTLAHEFKSKGVEVLSKDKNTIENESKIPLGKKAKRKARHNPLMSDSSSGESSESENETVKDDVIDKGIPKQKKIRLNEEELALGSMLIKGKKTRRDLIDAAWNRYTFNDENLPEWFRQDEEQHMRTLLPVPPEIADEYKKKVQELNIRPIKKVMEAKARKKRRAKKRLEKAKKKAEQILENDDGTARDKIRQIRKLYKKAEEKKKEITYVVSKKHLAGKRVRRPPGVKGRFKVVDPRMKKDKRATAVKEKRNKKSKRG